MTDYVIEDLASRYPTTTAPLDNTDKPRFGQLSETAKDSFQVELTNFLTYSISEGTTIFREIPNIEKFMIYSDASAPSLETTVRLIQSYGDTPDRFPMIAITSASVKQRNLGLGSNFVDHVQYPPSVEGSESGPFVITEDESFEVTTWPLGYAGDDDEYVSTTTLEMTSHFISDFSAVTVEEVVSAINKQALVLKAYVTSTGKLGLQTGGVAAKATPNYIEISDGDTNLLAALGFTIGDSQSYTDTDNPPKNRYYVAADMVVNIDVVSDDLNTRQELADLVFDFFTYKMEARRFQFLGRSYQNKTQDPEEWFHIILQNEFNWSAEYVKPRQGGEQYDQIYAVRGSVPITITDYIDKRMTAVPVFLDEATIEPSDTMPSGDHGGRNWIKDRG